MSAIILKGVIEGNPNARVEGVIYLMFWSFVAGILVGERRKVRDESTVKETPGS